MSEPMNKRPSRQRSSQGLNNTNKDNNKDTNSTNNLDSNTSNENVSEIGDRNGLITPSTTADDHQILAILAHMSQQQSGSLPNANRSTPSAPQAHDEHLQNESNEAGSPVINPTTVTGGTKSTTTKSKAKSKSSSPSSTTIPSTTAASTASLTFTSQLNSASNPNLTNQIPIASTSSSSTSTNGPPPTASSSSTSSSLANNIIKESKQTKSSKAKGKSKVIETNSYLNQEDQLIDDQNTPVGSGDEGLGNNGVVGGSGGKGKEEDWTRTRKDNHKEVERRRRETINEGINDLKQIVPGCEKNKGSILSSAVQYIQQLKDSEASNIEKWTLEKLLSDQVMEELKNRCEAYRLNGETLELELEDKNLQLLEMNKALISLREEYEVVRRGSTGKRTAEEIEEDDREEYKKQRRWAEMREETM